MKKTTSAKSKSPDGFVYFPDSPFGLEHGRLDEFLSAPKSSKLRAESVKFPKEEQVRLFCAALERMEFQKAQKRPNDALTEIIKTLAGRKLPYREEDASWLVNCAANIAKPADPENVQYEECNLPIPGVIPAILVPDRSSRNSGEQKVWLPFEGDNTLALILSKAFLLAEDTKIKDQSILRQIEGK